MKERKQSGPINQRTTKFTVGVLATGPNGADLVRNLRLNGYGTRVVDFFSAGDDGMLPADFARLPIIFSCLPDDVMRHFCSQSAWIQGLMPGCVHIATAMLQPDITGRLEKMHEAAAQYFVFSPILARSGRISMANLLFLMAGKGQAMDRVRPLLDDIAQDVIIAGVDVREASRLKIIQDNCAGKIEQALHDAMGQCRRQRVNPAALQRILRQTLCFSSFGPALLLPGSAD